MHTVFVVAIGEEGRVDTHSINNLGKLRYLSEHAGKMLLGMLLGTVDSNATLWSGLGETVHNLCEESPEEDVCAASGRWYADTLSSLRSLGEQIHGVRNLGCGLDGAGGTSGSEGGAAAEEAPCDYTPLVRAVQHATRAFWDLGYTDDDAVLSGGGAARPPLEGQEALSAAWLGLQSCSPVGPSTRAQDAKNCAEALTMAQSALAIELSSSARVEVNDVVRTFTDRASARQALLVVVQVVRGILSLVTTIVGLWHFNTSWRDVARVSRALQDSSKTIDEMLVFLQRQEQEVHGLEDALYHQKDQVPSLPSEDASAVGDETWEEREAARMREHEKVVEGMRAKRRRHREKYGAPIGARGMCPAHGVDKQPLPGPEDRNTDSAEGPAVAIPVDEAPPAECTCGEDDDVSSDSNDDEVPQTTSSSATSEASAGDDATVPSTPPCGAQTACGVPAKAARKRRQADAITRMGGRWQIIGSGGAGKHVQKWIQTFRVIEHCVVDGEGKLGKLRRAAGGDVIWHGGSMELLEGDSLLHRQGRSSESWQVFRRVAVDL